MEILELVKTGNWIDNDDRQWAWNIERIVSQLEHCFNEAFVSLILFDREKNTEFSLVEMEKQWLEDRERRNQIESSIKHDFDLKKSDDREKLIQKVESILNQEKLNNGDLPRYLKHEVQFIYAKSFLYSLDTIAKLINVLSIQPGVPDEISKIKDFMGENFPDLTNVRDSSHHTEDRVIGKQRKKTIELQPIDTDGIKADGGVLVLSNLSGSSFSCTMFNGHLGRVDVTRQSLDIVRGVIQSVIDSFQWK
ncbi:hypothetical protein [Citrobacter freundii]|uniref:hypothetical protein n=1 Tax=Citrobacter freundii TaxID=546 RepID=UPI002018CBE8|nr:hypothetical protein [Citrobacter freundii]UQQ24098.1 hypothetical protein LY266_15165 [Citrobacter freundii]UQQ27791.1 hypothetical protein LY266_10585 [Citrobacter freundii]